MILKTDEIVILQDERLISRVKLNDADWRAINFVDYIEVDADGILLRDYDVHGTSACARMQWMATKALLKLKWLKLGNKALRAFPSSPRQKKIRAEIVEVEKLLAAMEKQ